ncbi:ABC transporter, ATP-binding protein (cluster 9, phospholipid) [hydrothermal vent metagenome]|uniref:ABC transporter, ATP-binding protein (Cluster 9, phospholipid) n=1 Tax=hydrothermal vent metagenome TaxID=652676 RepID=A0A3B0Z1Q0_9ZZZZ
MTDQHPVIDVRSLVTYYGDQKILDDVSLSVDAGEIMVIMGGSGSGKSTLLRYMLGLHEADAGEIRLFGKDIGELSGREWTNIRKRIGVSFQGGALFNSMNVGENVRMPLREHTALDENTMKIMSRIKLEVVNLAGYEHLMPAQLSGGMIKRAALARAIVMDPGILFFDEPSAGLDPVVAADLDKLILHIRDAMQVSIVVVTHELESAFTIADRITVLDRGHILMVGTVEEVRNSDNPRIRNLLTRTSEEEPVDADDYLHRLTEGAMRV